MAPATISGGRLSAKLIEEALSCLLAAKTPDALALLLEKEETVPATRRQGLIIGVTGCRPSPTYLAAESLERAAKELGFEVKVETNGSIVKNSPTAAEIARASSSYWPATETGGHGPLQRKPSSAGEGSIKDGKG